jgi:hypothetical protein
MTNQEVSNYKNNNYKEFNNDNTKNNNIKSVDYTGYEEDTIHQKENNKKSEYVNYNINEGTDLNYIDSEVDDLNYIDSEVDDFYNNNLIEYNRNIKTQNLGPSLYKYNEILEPINSNIGISLTQSMPYVKEINNNGNIYINEVKFKIPEKEKEVIGPEFHNVYDPRFNGYGTSYRTYIEPVTGQPRFMYDDINALKMPNYIVRSNIDHIKSANSYGTLEESNKNGIQNFLDLRKKVEKEWVDNSITFRTDMMERLMRKRNNELEQTRRMPIVKSAYTSRG